jgi:hypothetical protein
MRQGRTIARQLESAKRDRNKNGRYREQVELCYGRTVVCESQAERDWWEQYVEALQKGHIKPDDFSFKDLFCSLVKDGREMVESWNPQYGPSAGCKWQEAAGAIMSSDFSNISGQLLYTAMVDNLTPEETVFQDLIPTVQTPFSGERIPGLTGLGDQAEIVPENKEFPYVGITEDWIETPPTLKRGFIVPLTKEALFFDRTGMLLQKAGAVGDSMRLNKEKRAIDCLIDENTTTHRYKWRGTTYATYQTTTPWDNVTASNALVDWTDLDAVEQTAAALVDPFTGEPVTVEYNTIIVGPGLAPTARRIVNATEITVATPGYATTGNPTVTRTPVPVRVNYRIVSSRQLAARLATDTDWFMGDPARYAKYMQNWPITVSEAGAGSYDEFKRDIIVQFKASERGQYAVVQPRAMAKSTVA